MATKQFVAGWALIVIGCCGNGSSAWVNAVIGGIGLVIVMFDGTDDKEPK